MEILLRVFDVLFPVFLTIAIGYWYGKKNPKFETTTITNFAGSIGLPCIIFYSLTISNIAQTPIIRPNEIAIKIVMIVFSSCVGFINFISLSCLIICSTESLCYIQEDLERLRQ